MPVDIEYDEGIAEDIIRELGFEVETSLAEMASEAKINAPADTGNLADRIYSGAEVSGNQIRGKLWTDSGYAAPVEFGSGLWGPKSDYIYPKKAKMLAWRTKSGEWVRAKRVKGQPPQPFLKPAIDKTIPKMLKRFKNIVKRVGLDA